MNSSFRPQGHPAPQPQQQPGPYQLQPGQQQQSFPAGTPPGPFPNPASFQQFPQQPLNPQQQQQFAQWAYQQMMFQQQQLAFQPHGPNPQSPFMTPQQQQALQMQFMQQQQQLMMQQQQQHAAAQQQQQHQFPRPPQPPYARENNSSKTSLNSNNGDGSGRRRTTSNKSAPGRSRTGSSTGTSQASVNGKGTTPPPPQTHRHRVPSTSSHRSASSSTAAPNRNQSTMSSATSSQSSISSSSTAQASNTSGPSKTQRQPSKPSPLSQGSHTGVSKPSYRDVASSAVKPPAKGPQEPAPTPEMVKSGGLTGRLRRALSFSALDEAGHDDAKNGSRRKAVNAKLASEGQIPRSASTQLPRPSTDSTMTLGQNTQSPSSSVPSPVAYVPTEGSIRSTETAQAPKKSRSLFNAKFNRSTDNMSLSSTVSSASMMIRKLGSVGKLVRRNSLMGISSVFKGKKDKDRAESDGEAPPEGGDKKKGKFKNPLKSRKAEASVSHATAEVEAVGDTGNDELAGLSPAAKLVRQHTLRTKADEARAQADQDRRSEETTHSQTPSTWEKNTATRGGNLTRKSVNEVGGWNGDDDDYSEDGSTFDGHRHQPPAQDWRDPADFEDSDEEQEYGDGYEEEDETVRFEAQYGDNHPADEPWAVGLRRSVERTRVPTKGILKYADSYNQNQYLDGPPQAPFTRVRSNSNDSAPPMGAEPGPLARIPSPDPDHIDGLHRSNSGSDRHSHHSRKLSTSSNKSNNSAGGSAFLPALNFGDETDSSSLAASLSAFGAAGGKERPLSGHSNNFPYSNADFNASAPALATLASSTANLKQPSMGLRSATVPLTRSSKKLTFAANLSVYHTFSPAAYDRRSEPATCNRLTPTLAQRIKEELNSYKMEEMEVHQASRMHTHFFV
ncbi:hypothetical protein FRB90_012209 [Tulasnella sp. 427]|nr:hypothetical protein FRB90_012209 [Tulasnella sp. 427]